MFGEDTMTPVRDTTDDLYTARTLWFWRVAYRVLVLLSLGKMEALPEFAAHLVPHLAVRVTWLRAISAYGKKGSYGENVH